MSNLTILIFENKIFFEILKELKLFPKFKIKYSENIDLSLKELQKDDQISVFFKNSLIQVKSNSLQEQLKLPFKILDFEKKITSLLAKNEFKKIL